MNFCWMVKPQLLAVIFIRILLGHVQVVECFTFDFPLFKPEGQNGLILSDFSRIFRDAIQVTPDAYGEDLKNRSGRAFYNKAYRVWSNKKNQTASFNTSFIFNISPNTPSNPGAGEGLAFILAADTSLPPNSYGRWLGIVNSSTNGTSDAAILAVEFDTRNNSPDDGPNGHVGVNVNSIYSIKQVPLLPLGINISSGVNVSVRIQYDNDVISVFGYMMNGSQEDLLLQSSPLNLTSHLPEKVYLGFSASTSNFNELNCIRSWQFDGEDIGDGNQDLLWVWITAPTVGVIIAGAAIFLLIWRWRRRGEITEDAYPRIEDQIKCSSMAPKKFRLREIKRATANFNEHNKLGEGGFGTVYKGMLGNREIAVKRVSKDSRQGKQEFIAEVTTIGSLHHKNLVKLIGWCYERNELLLVYEFMPNGSLDRYLFERSDGSPYQNLYWETRYNVIKGVAEALDYLHNGCDKKVIHRDIKASNIMLDSDFNAKLGDFGLARTIQKRNDTHHSTQGIAGTPGYMAPETFLTGRATVETDVYAFGVMIMEVVCGKRPGKVTIENDYKNSVVYWVWEMYGNGKTLDGVDKRIKKEIEGDEERVERVIMLGLACCHPNPHKRPSMKTVSQVLTGEVAPPDVPRERPAFMWPAAPPSFNVHDSSVTSAGLTPPFTQLTGR
ncbi:hypothetical protein QN277_013260 [Acacia crassicarpa]|nr:hypothetical protein QN277_013260 [Acacia crassicarpa]